MERIRPRKKKTAFVTTKCFFYIIIRIRSEWLYLYMCVYNICRVFEPILYLTYFVINFILLLSTRHYVIACTAVHRYVSTMTRVCRALCFFGVHTRTPPPPLRRNYLWQNPRWKSFVRMLLLQCVGTAHAIVLRIGSDRNFNSFLYTPTAAQVCWFFFFFVFP